MTLTPRVEFACCLSQRHASARRDKYITSIQHLHDSPFHSLSLHILHHATTPRSNSHDKTPQIPAGRRLRRRPGRLPPAPPPAPAPAGAVLPRPALLVARAAAE